MIPGGSSVRVCLVMMLVPGMRCWLRWPGPVYALLLSPHRGDNPVAGQLIVVGLFAWLLVVIFAAMAERVPACADPPGDPPDPVS